MATLSVLRKMWMLMLSCLGDIHLNVRKVMTMEIVPFIVPYVMEHTVVNL